MSSSSFGFSFGASHLAAEEMDKKKEKKIRF